MTTAVALNNLALAHLGDDATVSSIDPPEGSAQAEHCAQFYPIARNSLLEMHPWKFAMRRAALAVEELDPVSQWAFAYALPSNLIQVFKVSGPNDLTDGGGYAPYGDRTASYASGTYYPVDNRGLMIGSQDFEVETQADGRLILLTNQADAWARFTVTVTDPNLFAPLFVTALSYFLASMLAGPVLKGETGRTVSVAMLQQFRLFMGQAAVSDARQRQADSVRENHVAPWMANR